MIRMSRWTTIRVRADLGVGPVIFRHSPGIGGPAGAPAPTMPGGWSGCRG